MGCHQIEAVVVFVSVFVFVLLGVVVAVVEDVAVAVVVVVQVDAGLPLCAVCDGMLEGEGGRMFSVGVMG